MANLLIQSPVIVLAADFITGMIHWWEDAYGNPKWKILGKHVIEPNLRHHSQPREFLKGNYWQRNNTSIIAAAVLTIVPFLLGIRNVVYTAIILLASQGNEVHRKAHQSDKENGRFICFLQRIGLMQSRRHHGWHHKAPYDCNYCILTNYLNPLLGKIRFWERLESFIKTVFGITPLRGSILRNGK